MKSKPHLSHERLISNSSRNLKRLYYIQAELQEITDNLLELSLASLDARNIDLATSGWGLKQCTETMQLLRSALDLDAKISAQGLGKELKNTTDQEPEKIIELKSSATALEGYLCTNPAHEVQEFLSGFITIEKDTATNVSIVAELDKIVNQLD